ncbi:MAG: hypothetical protein HY696_03645 [Deltaproteobacteria bacterium]|nr:hypothetical protein [Deltaproteobacteria bacterium]
MSFALCLFLSTACSRQLPFSDYQREEFSVTAITADQEKVIRLVNPNETEAQHVRAIAFDAGGNPGGHFAIAEITVGGKTFQPRDILIPPRSALEIHILYAPRDLQTSRVAFGGWETGQPPRLAPLPPPDDSEPEDDAAPEPESATGVAAALLGRATARAAASTPAAIHRALIVLTYDYPQEGVMQVEVIGQAVAGPHGEITATGSTEPEGPIEPGTCTANGTTACFTGDFSLGLPELVEGEFTTPLAGPLPLMIDGASATLEMAQFPVSLFTFKNIPGLPVDAITLAISGDKGSTATGDFDGTALTLRGIGFRVRIYLGEKSLDALAGASTFAEFSIRDLEMTTLTPLASGTITLGIDTKLGANPTGNGLADSQLAGKRVVVKLTGTLELPK